MITENLSTLKIHKLTQEQYNRELAAGNIDENALYLTPDEEVDLSGYATIEQLNTKAEASDVTALETLVGDEKVSDQISTAMANNAAGSAVKLETARKINGVEFDGTVDITTPASFGVTTSGTGAAYTATVNGITTLTAGISLTIIPHTQSTTTTPTLNINNLGAKTIRRRRTTYTNNTYIGYAANWLSLNTPIRVEYNGTYWIADMPKPHADDIDGVLKIGNGGTGATTASDARTNLQVCQSIPDSTYPDCHYRMNGTTKEWINPPMIAGTEYRTTERYENKPVYVKLINAGAMANTGTTNVTVGTNLTIVSIDGKATSGKYVIPIHVINSINSIYYHTTNGTITIETNKDASSWTATLIVKYTK